MEWNLYNGIPSSIYPLSRIFMFFSSLHPRVLRNSEETGLENRCRKFALSFGRRQRSVGIIVGVIDILSGSITKGSLEVINLITLLIM